MRRILSALLLFSFVIGVPSISHARTGPVFSVPFTWSEKGHIMVDAVINDSWRLPMIVDTGAQFALLPRAAIEKLDIKKAEISVQHAMTASDTRQLEVITIDKITVGGHSVANLNGLLLDLHDLPGHGQAPGVLPMSFLNGFTVQFDLANQRLAFYDKQLPVKAFLDLDKYATIPYQSVHGFIRFPVSINGQEFPAILDTGASAEPIMNWRAANALGVDQTSEKLKEVEGIKGAGTTHLPTASYAFDSFFIGGVRMPAANMRIADMPHFRQLIGDGPAMNVGLSTLGPISVVVDYTNHVLYLGGAGS